MKTILRNRGCDFNHIGFNIRTTKTVIVEVRIAEIVGEEEFKSVAFEVKQA